MSTLPSIRKELQECFSHCERLLANAFMSDNPPFSEEEVAMTKYYAEELRKISASRGMKFSVSDKQPGTATGGHHLTGRDQQLSLHHEQHEWGWWDAGKRK